MASGCLASTFTKVKPRFLVARFGSYNQPFKLPKLSTVSVAPSPSPPQTPHLHPAPVSTTTPTVLLHPPPTTPFCISPSHSRVLLPELLQLTPEQNAFILSSGISDRESLNHYCLSVLGMGEGGWMEGGGRRGLEAGLEGSWMDRRD